MTSVYLAVKHADACSNCPVANLPLPPHVPPTSLLKTSFNSLSVVHYQEAAYLSLVIGLRACPVHPSLNPCRTRGPQAVSPYKLSSAVKNPGICTAQSNLRMTRQYHSPYCRLMLPSMPLMPSRPYSNLLHASLATSKVIHTASTIVRVR